LAQFNRWAPGKELKTAMQKLACISSLFLGCFAAAASAAPAQQPNILFIFCDDHTTQAISAYGEKRKLIETPNIDRLARQGILFSRCLVPNSICGPVRATILTGKYSHLNGFYNNETTPFDGAQQTFPKLLQQAGYQTALVGKWHLESDPTGFDHWHILPGQGIYYNPPMIRNGQPVKHEGYTTDLITDFSIDWLKQRDTNRPFMLMSQHKAPHREWAPALRHLGWDNDRVYPEPETLFDDYGNGRGLAWRDQDMTLEQAFNDRDAKLVPPPYLTPEQRTVWDAYYEPRNEAFRQANPQGKDLVRWRYQRYMHDYLGTIKAVDESVGRLLQYLDDTGLAENTVVVYCSDQGFFLGEHGWFDKRWILEESLRTPLVVRWPGVTPAGSVNGDIVSVLDFAQTFLDIAGQPLPADMQGRSLVPLLKGHTPADWRTSFYYHYYEYPVWHKVRPHYGVVTDRYKLVHYYKPDVDDWELYDRRSDPMETRNLIDDPDRAGIVTELKAEIARLRSELKVPDEAPRHAYGKYPFDGPGTPPQPKAAQPASKATARDGENHWERRKEFLIETIQAFDPDLLGTQETEGFQRDYLAQHLPQYDYLGVGRNDGRESGEMMALYYKKERFEKLAGDHFWLSETPDQVGSKSWDSSLPRMVTWVQLRDRHRAESPPILFLNTHFDHLGARTRVESARLLRRQVAALGQGCSVIVTGDFNAGEDSEPYRALFAPVEEQPSPLVDTFRVAHPQRGPNEGTFSGFKADAIGGARIDWIGISRDWQLVQAEIDRTARDGRTPSDHFPVTAMLRAKPTGPGQ
jgi:arylsulfatase A-like enzyme/endonuclease/exonuclease/phosphatase family metal-dependent hydrolase